MFIHNRLCFGHHYAHLQEEIFDFKNLKRRLHETTASIWFIQSVLLKMAFVEQTRREILYDIRIVFSNTGIVLSDYVGFTLLQATKALRESVGIALLYFRPLH